MNPELDKYDAASQQPQSVKIEVNVNEINVILGALGELPHRVSDPLIRKVFAQAQEQLQAK